MSRGYWWSQLGSRWPELAPATSLAADGARVSSNSSLGGKVRRVECTVGLLVMRWSAWTQWRGRWVAGASSAMSSATVRAGELRALVVVHEKESGEDGEVARLTAN